MKVKDLIGAAAQTLGIEEEVGKHFEGIQTAVGEKDVELLLACFQRVERELAIDFLPLLAEDEVVTATGIVEYAALQRAVARVFCVEDEWGNSVKYRLFPQHLKTQAGKVKVIYGYLPTEKTVEGESEYESSLVQNIFVYGMAAEYSLAVGELTEAKAWEEKYKESVQAAYRTRPCKRLRSRRWV